MHFESALAEVLLKVVLVIGVLAKRDVREGVLILSLLLFFLLVLLCSDCFFVLGCKVDGLLDKRLDHEDIKVELFTDHLSLLFLASEGVADKAQFQREPVWVLRVHELGPLFKVDLNDLFEGITEQEVVCW